MTKSNQIVWDFKKLLALAAGGGGRRGAATPQKKKEGSYSHPHTHARRASSHLTPSTLWVWLPRVLLFAAPSFTLSSCSPHLQFSLLLPPPSPCCSVGKSGYKTGSKKQGKVYNSKTLVILFLKKKRETYVTLYLATHAPDCHYRAPKIITALLLGAHDLNHK